MGKSVGTVGRLVEARTNWILNLFLYNIGYGHDGVNGVHRHQGPG